MSLFQQYDIEAFEPYLYERNPSAGAPYHGAKHTLAMMNFVAEGCACLCVPAQQTQNAILAALFHDFNHFQGYIKDDRLNIENAVRGFAEIAVHHSLDEWQTLEVIQTIRNTQFPLPEHISVSELPLVSLILRDSDLMMPYLPMEEAVRLQLGLKEELERRRGPMDLEAYLFSTILFYREQVIWNTSWAQAKADAFELNDVLIPKLVNTIRTQHIVR